MTEELWTIRGNTPVLWRIPVYVTWTDYGPEGAAIPAVPLLRIQQKAFDELMTASARKVNGVWMIMRAELRRLAKLAVAGTDPETLIVWERPRQAQKAYNHPEKREERDAFLDALYLNGVGSSRDEVSHWWFLFCEHALDWVINRELPVDMFFVRITPLPYRFNWLERTEKRRVEVSRTKKHLRDPGRFRDWLHDGRVLAINANGTLVRHLALEHLPLWWKTIKRVESTRLARLKPERYAQVVIESVRRAIPAATRIYETWLAQKTVAVAVYDQSRNAGRNRFVAGAASARDPAANWGTSAKYRNVLWIVNRKKHDELCRKAKALSRQNGNLPAVSDIQQTTQDVRDGGDAGPGGQ